MAKASRKLLLALLTIAVCIALLAAGTYALFSREFSVTNHLVAGNLNVTLTRTNLEAVTLGADGHLVSSSDKTEKDFTNAGSENLFGLTESTRIAPGCKFTADLKLTNAGSVAFSYWLEVKLKGDTNDEALAEQLKVTLTADSKTQEGMVSEGLTIGSQEQGIGVVVVKESAEFTVCVEFADDVNNNAAMSQSVQFDIVIHAIQDATVS